MFKKYEWLLLDLDNTLLDFSASSKLAFRDLVMHFEIPGETNELYAKYSPINAKYWNYFEKQKVDASTLRNGRFKDFLDVLDVSRNASEMASKYLEFLIEHSFWLPNAEKTLKDLSGNYNLAIVTNGLREAQHARLEKHDMKKYFDHIFISEELGYSKPHDGFFKQVHETIESPKKDRVLIIGDNPKSDIKGGRDFNYDTCWFNYKQERGKRVNATMRINEWRDLKDLK